MSLREQFWSERGKAYLSCFLRTYLVGASMPWAVVRPKGEEQNVELLKWADAERVPLVPRSRGTGMQNQSTGRGVPPPPDRGALANVHLHHQEDHRFDQ